MSLDYNLSAVPDANWKDEKGNMSEMTYCIIHTLAGVRVETVTEDNCTTIVERQRQHNEASGPRGWNLKGEENYLFTVDDVRKFVGLTTNACVLSAVRWEKFLRLERVYSTFRRHNKNEIPNNNTVKDDRHFSMRGLYNPTLYKELRDIGGKFVKIPDEVGHEIAVYIIENY